MGGRGRREGSKCEDLGWEVHSIGARSERQFREGGDEAAMRAQGQPQEEECLKEKLREKEKVRR